MWGTKSGASQHGNRGFGDHRHVDRDPISSFHAKLYEGIRRLLHFSKEFGIGNCSSIARFTFKMKSDAIASAFFNMAIKTVNGGIERSADKPLRVWGLPVQCLIPVLIPLQLFSLRLPECDTVLVGLRINKRLSIGVCGKFVAWLEGTCLGQ